MNQYTEEFFDSVAGGSLRSAEAMIPLLMETIRPRSVLDVGCGQGWWLKALRDFGVEDILGIDGDYIRRSDLVIPRDRFLARDLRSQIRLSRRFDLVLSLEVAEHLPPDCAEGFVESLVAHAPCVLFSAAIPGQGGVHHVNEQWPSYWAGLFARLQFYPLDFFRRRYWACESVDYWYAQNAIVFFKEGAENDYPGLRRFESPSSPEELDVVHPRQFLRTHRRLEEANRALWHAQAQLVSIDLAEHVPSSERVAVADRGWLPLAVTRGERIVRLAERVEFFQGAPADAQTALDALVEWRGQGGNWFLQTWEVFWWDECYDGFATYLNGEAECVLSNERCRIYRFRLSRNS